MYKPYLIRTPEYNPVSGGIKVMYGLYGHLLAKGLPAYLNTRIDIPSVGVYPEIYHGNDMNASNVIRYILQTPGLMGTSDQGEYRSGPTSFPPTDEIYVFSKVYDEWNTPDNHILFLPVINLMTFKDLNKKRDKVAFYVGKGANLGKHPKDSIEITREFAADQQALNSLLNECKTLYVYDRLSAIMEVARLSGCEIIYWGELPQEKLELYEPGMNGISYRDVLQRSLHSQSFRERYKQLFREFSIKLDGFIERTQ